MERYGARIFGGWAGKHLTPSQRIFQLVVGPRPEALTVQNWFKTSVSLLGIPLGGGEAFTHSPSQKIFLFYPHHFCAKPFLLRADSFIASQHTLF